MTSSDRRAPRRRPDVLKGFSSRFLAELDRTERTRNYLAQGDLRSALDRWTTWVRSPMSRDWMDTIPWEWDYYEDENPFRAREILEAVACALPRKSARELRERLKTLDDLY